MAYRSEEDALRARNEALEMELAQERGERAKRDAQHEQELLAARGLASKSPQVPGRRAAQVRGWFAVGLITVVVVGVAFAMNVHESPSASAPSTQTRVVHALWHATLKSATGTELAPGTACQIESTLTYRSAAASARYATAKVTCGASVVYDSQDQSESTATTLDFTDTFRDLGGDPQQRVVELEYNEEGPRTRQKPRAAISTRRGMAAFTRELPVLRVELTVTPGSVPAPLLTQ